MEEVIKNLIIKFLNRTISEPEKQMLEEWKAGSEHNRKRAEKLTRPKQLAESVQGWIKGGGDPEEAWETLQAKLQSPEDVPLRKIPTIRKYWYAAAAVLIILVGTAIYFRYATSDGISEREDSSQIVKADVSPGRDRATLTLASGKIIILDSSAGGVLGHEGEIDIIKREGLLTYQGSGSGNENAVYNTLTVPKGGQYRLLLNDGTKVWLNSASSIRYPAVFASGKARTVEVTGEVYFEVASLANVRTKGKLPFIVETSKGISIEVLGTQFNINAYDDEPVVATTLLEGKVKVHRIQGNDKDVQILKPGEQALSGANTEFEIRKDADIESVMSWKNGKFHFKDTDLATIMRQISRWYDVDIVYEGKIPKIELNGEASRSLTLTNLLEMLQLTDVRCRVEGNKLIIPEEQ